MEDESSAAPYHSDSLAAVLTADSNLRFVSYLDVFEHGPRAASRNCGGASELISSQPNAGYRAAKISVSEVSNPDGKVLLNSLEKRAWFQRWLARKLHDFQEYSTKATVRCAINESIFLEIRRADSLGRPVIVVCHSLGAWVVWDVLQASANTASQPAFSYHAGFQPLKRVQRFVLLGSQLPADGPREDFVKLRSPPQGIDSAPLHFHRIAQSTVGFKGRFDLVGMHLRKSISFQRDSSESGVVDIEIDTDPSNPHSEVSYLKHPLVALSIAGAWCADVTRTACSTLSTPVCNFDKLAISKLRGHGSKTDTTSAALLQSWHRSGEKEGQRFLFFRIFRWGWRDKIEPITPNGRLLARDDWHTCKEYATDVHSGMSRNSSDTIRALPLYIGASLTEARSDNAFAGLVHLEIGSGFLGILNRIDYVKRFASRSPLSGRDLRFWAEKRLFTENRFVTNGRFDFGLRASLGAHIYVYLPLSDEGVGGARSSRARVGVSHSRGATLDWSPLSFFIEASCPPHRACLPLPLVGTGMRIPFW